MRNRKYKSLPYDVNEKATAGEMKAVNTVVRHYTGYIKYLFYLRVNINDDLQDYLKSQLMETSISLLVQSLMNLTLWNPANFNPAFKIRIPFQFSHGKLNCTITAPARREYGFESL